MRQPKQLQIEVIDPATLTAPAARVLIAKDALALLDAEAIVAGTSYYMSVLSVEQLDMSAGGSVVTAFENARDNSDSYGYEELVKRVVLPGYTLLHEWLADAPVCQVCALGATFVASARRFNKISVAELPMAMRVPYAEYLQQFFSTDQLDLIEVAFEGAMCARCDHERVSHQEAKSFYRKFSTDNERLRAILGNIVENNGEFVL
jgi:hypothetical protein